MRCLCLFLGPARPSHRVIPKHATPSFNVGVPSSVSPPGRRRPKSLVNDGVSTSQQEVGELGHTLLATLQTNPVVPIPKSQQPRKKEGEEAQISGSEVLWALQRASARKNKKKNKKQEQRRVPSSVATPREESAVAVDYTNVRPLCINPNWAAKLDELDKRLLCTKFKKTRKSCFTGLSLSPRPLRDSDVYFNMVKFYQMALFWWGHDAILFFLS